MSHLRAPGSRSLTVVLSESEWQALRDIEPDAVGWLQECIRERLSAGAGSHATHAATSPSLASAASSWGDDEY